MGTSILATICAERLTKYLVRYSRAQSTSTPNICCNSQSIRRFFPVIDKFVPQKKTTTPVLPPMAERKYASVWLHRPTLVKPKMYGEVIAKKNLPLSSARIAKPNVPLCSQLPRGQLTSVSRKFLAVQPKLAPKTSNILPTIAGIIQMKQPMVNKDDSMVQQTRMKSTASRYCEYYPKPAHCQTYGDYLKKFERLKFCRNWQ